MLKTLRDLRVLNGSILLPPDKSIAHRAAMFAALADGESMIENYSPAADPQTTLKVISALGAEVNSEGSTVVIRSGGRSSLKSRMEVLDCENSGTTMRLITGILSGAGVECTLIGDASLSNRPMKRVMSPLTEMGATIDARDGSFPPLVLKKNSGLRGIDFTLPMPSAQLKSCVLLAGLFADGETIVRESIRSRNHTEVLLQLHDEVLPDGTRLILSSRDHVIPTQNYAVPGDFSSAAFWMVAGSIMEDGEILIQNVGLNPTRDALLAVLQRMGADIRVLNERSAGAERVADLQVKPAPLQSTELTESEVAIAIDEIPVLTVAMAFAEGRSLIRRAKELRVKECDRIDAMAAVLRGMGIPFEEFEDGLEIHGRPDHRFKDLWVDSRHDHRIAMSGAVAAVRSHGEVTIDGAEHAAVSYATFWEDLENLR